MMTTSIIEAEEDGLSSAEGLSLEVVSVEAEEALVAAASEVEALAEEVPEVNSNSNKNNYHGI